MPPSDQPARAARQAQAHSLKVARAKATQAELAAQVAQSRCGAWGGWGRPKQAEPPPLVAIHFPEPPACDGMHIVQPCAPTAAHWVLYFIVSGYNPNGHEGPNIDVSKLQVFGIPLDPEETPAPGGGIGGGAPLPLGGPASHTILTLPLTNEA